MRAGLVTGPRRFELVESPAPAARPGTRVVAGIASPCGQCANCHAGRTDDPSGAVKVLVDPRAG